MSDQLDMFGPELESGHADLPWRMRVYAELTGQSLRKGTTDYGRWIGARWFEFYAAHPALARRRDEDERAWFPRFLDNQDVFDTWLAARLAAGEPPVSRMGKLDKPYYEAIDDIAEAA